MKRTILFLFLTLGLSSFAQTAYEYKIITTIESIVPMGVGRSRIVEHNVAMDYKQATSTRDQANKFKKKQNQT